MKLPKIDWSEVALIALLILMAAMVIFATYLFLSPIFRGL